MDVITALGGFANVTAGTLLAVTVIMILTGRLVPKSHLDAVIVERDAWKSAAIEADKARTKTEMASWKAVHALTSVEKVITSIVPPSEDEGGGTDEVVGSAPQE